MSRFIILLIGLVASLPGYATPQAGAEAVPEAFRACAVEKDDALRLACFDRELARVVEPVAAPQSPAAKLTPEERFGRVGAISLEESRKERRELPAIAELTATVSAVATRAYGEVVMTLDNGQIWSQQTADSHFSVKPADRITIKAGALGSFIAISPGGRTTRVVRLK